MSNNSTRQTSEPFNLLSEVQLFYYVNLLGLKKPKWDRESTDQAIIEAKVDLNPHQIEAATFAFRNPLAGGVILADEVGLGKTIETGLILSQLWAEGRRSVLVIAPKSLRHQWQDELKNLFGLESSIIDTQSLRAIHKASGTDPFSARDKILITNEHFFNKHADKVKSIAWDLIVIDEAHKLRNVWRPGKKQSQRAKLIRESIRPFRKLLLTATPMQNNLMELYGLTSFIEDSILGTQESFQQTFLRIPEEEREERLAELKYRMQKFFHRELRKNVSDFIRYTKRNAVTFEFSAEDEEEQLRKDFEAYLTRDDILGIPPMASHLLKLIYCKLLASSSFALKNSLLGIYKRFVLHAVSLDDRKLFDKLILEIRSELTTEKGTSSQELEDFEKLLFKKVRPKSFDGLKESIAAAQEEDLSELDEEIAENYDEDDIEEVVSGDLAKTTPDHEVVLLEARQVLEFIRLTKKIRENTKGDALKKALDEQFRRAKKEGWPEKAVIFTEFKTTQQYVINVLEQMGMTLDRDIVIFNGSVGDAESRRRLVNEFRTEKKVFLTTEAGAEGLNLQFCNLIINYDLPWNPQRIEQRIGRCHRYGQKLDVVVVNFVNKRNHADRRVLELLNEKFHLFEGAFGVSDEVLGAIQSGTDIEKEILGIYLNCRTPTEIDSKFAEMMEKNRDLVDERLSVAKAKLLNEFDEDVQKRLKDVHQKAREAIDAKQAIVRDCILSTLPQSMYSYNEGILLLTKEHSSLKAGVDYCFIKKSPQEGELIHSGHEIFKSLLPKKSFSGHVRFNMTGKHKITLLEQFIGKSGSFKLHRVRINGIESFDALIPIFVIGNQVMEAEQAHKLLTISSSLVERTVNPDASALFTDALAAELDKCRQTLVANTEELYHEELEKIEHLFEDLERQKRYEKENLQKEIEELKKARRKLPLKAQSELNAEISKLKDKQLRIDEELAQIGRDSRDREKKLIASLEEKITTGTESELIGFGSFEVA